MASANEDVAKALKRALASLEPNVRAQREAFERRLCNGVELARAYENDEWKARARAAMPMDEIRRRGRTIAREGRTEETTTMSDDDGTLLALLEWFKKDFFTWVNAVKCETCKQDMKLARMDSARSAEERDGQAGRVEVYACSTCSTSARFPRYNSAIKLLETRRGRCGEWANAFMLCARAMGYRARWCLDWTDHVWTEVWSENQRAWLHCDPCENVCDKPLLYEQGWGKSLTYVIAFSIDGVVDVTRRYTKDMSKVWPRRGEVYEPWLAQQLKSHTQQLRLRMLPKEVEALELEDTGEQEELCRDAVDVGESFPGRRSGSIAWRLARGELGNK